MFCHCHCFSQSAQFCICFDPKHTGMKFWSSYQRFTHRHTRSACPELSHVNFRTAGSKKRSSAWSFYIRRTNVGCNLLLILLCFIWWPIGTSALCIRLEPLTVSDRYWIWNGIWAKTTIWSKRYQMFPACNMSFLI